MSIAMIKATTLIGHTQQATMLSRLLVVMAVAFSSLVGTVVYASCGDYLQIHEDGYIAMPALEQVVDPMADFDNDSSPCRKPFCRGVPETPLPSAPDRSLSNDFDRWCAALAAEINLSTSLARARFDEPFCVSDGYKSRIDRPPRN